MRALILSVLLVATPAAAASPSIELFNCGYQVIGVGDSVGKLKSACGQPDRVVALQTREGGAAGTRYEYDRNGGTVMFTVSTGRVKRIERI
jgi:hypothetical protein